MEQINISLQNLQDFHDVLETQVLMRDNEEEFIPTADYEPATKKYVDDEIEKYSIPQAVYAFDGQVNNVNNKAMFKELAYKIGYDNPVVLVYKNNPSIYNGVALFNNKIKSTHYFIDTNYDKKLTNGEWDNTNVEKDAYGVEYLDWTIMKIEYDEATNTISVNDNFKKIRIPKESNYLGLNNVTEFTPTQDYHPATKKYVDDLFNSYNDTINAELAKLTTPIDINSNLQELTDAEQLDGDK